MSMVKPSQSFKSSDDYKKQYCSTGYIVRVCQARAVPMNVIAERRLCRITGEMQVADNESVEDVKHSVAQKVTELLEKHIFSQTISSSGRAIV